MLVRACSVWSSHLSCTEEGTFFKQRKLNFLLERKFFFDRKFSDRLAIIPVREIPLVPRKKKRAHRLCVGMYILSL